MRSGGMLLLTNDDGIHADGLRALEKAARLWQSDVITVAPLEPHAVQLARAREEIRPHDQ